MNESQMKIEPHEITVRELIANYKDNGEEGVWGYGGKLNIRPPYQREFVYNDKQKKAVIESIMNGFPLNVMYWSVNDDGTYEIIDGQQRAMSICEYCHTNKSFGFKIDGIERGFQNLREERKNKILDYKLMIYFCKGTSDDKRDWFKIINTAGEQLTNQELLNAIFSGSWVTDAKRYFSKRNCMAAERNSKKLYALEHNGTEQRVYIPEKVMEFFDNEFDHRETANCEDLTNLAVALFIGMTGGPATTLSGGGGSSSNYSNWCQDEDDIRYAKAANKKTRQTT